MHLLVVNTSVILADIMNPVLRKVEYLKDCKNVGIQSTHHIKYADDEANTVEIYKQIGIEHSKFT